MRLQGGSHGEPRRRGARQLPHISLRVGLEPPVEEANETIASGTERDSIDDHTVRQREVDAALR
jgi:hypothetical protein